MSEHEVFSDSMYDEQTHLAERELSAFISAVTERFGPQQARASAQDWLDEAEMMDSPPRSNARDWRAVTIAASARLASRIDAVQYRRKSSTKSTHASTDTRPAPISSSNCFNSVLLF
jgi:hypothetical protein